MIWHYTWEREPKVGMRVRVHSSETWGIGTAIYAGDGRWEQITPLGMSSPVGQIDSWAVIPAAWWQFWRVKAKLPALPGSRAPA